MGRTEALRSLRGLSVGDAYGQALARSPYREPPTDGRAGSWRWTDATHAALSVTEMLLAQGALDPDALARSLALRWAEDPGRGYGSGAAEVLKGVLAGEPWSRVAPALFAGQGSWGNGAAVRAAPIGAFFAGDPGRAALEADRSSVVTHSHLEGRVGATAVAVAAAMLATADPPRGDALLTAVAEGLPKSRTREGLEAALKFSPAEPEAAASKLGTGQRYGAADTVPFCLWVVARHGRHYERALAMACKPSGSHHSTGAIVGGLSALLDPRIPPEWLRLREPLPPALEA